MPHSAYLPAIPITNTQMGFGLICHSSMLKRLVRTDPTREWPSARFKQRSVCHAIVQEFTHVDETKRLPRMVNVGNKIATKRIAIAQSVLQVPPQVFASLMKDATKDIHGPKGPIVATSIIAGVMGAKRTSELIPFCHQIPLEDCQITMEWNSDLSHIVIECRAEATHKTGIEMEALTGATIAALSMYDMCKALSHEIIIAETKLIHKSGGKNDFDRINS